MKQHFGINGFGKIGRTSFRVWWHYHRDSIDLKVINTSGSMEIEDWVYLIKYDTNYGPFDEQITINRLQSKSEVNDENSLLGTIEIGDHSIAVTAQRDPAKIPWGKFQVHTVIESTGVFTSREKAMAHFTGGAEQVVISAPGKGEGLIHSVIGVRDVLPSADTKQVVSNESCTTNSVAPVMQILSATVGIESAMLTTIHSYTDDQNLQDNSHKQDLRRGRSAAANIVPTSTGAAKATTEIIPELEGVFDGLAVRVPTAVGSLSDITIVTKNPTSIEEINQIFEEASKLPKWQGILAVTTDPIVSSDIVGRRESAIVDLGLTNVVGKRLIKVISWYDNEYGYCNRLVEQVKALAM